MSMRFSGASIRQAGFSLIELMVGLVIGLFAVVMMMQMFQTWDERKRTAASGNDATLSGVSAYYDLQRRIRQAGYGFNSTSLMNCALTLRTGVPAIPLAPVTINPPTSLVPQGDPNTDRLLVVSGNPNSQPEGNVVQSNDGTNYIVQMSSAFAIDDWVFASPDTCATATLTKVTAIPSDTKVRTVAAPINASMLVNMGRQPSILAYAVRSGQLAVCDYMTHDCSASSTAPAWAPVAANIVSLRAQYGRDTSSTADGVLDLFDQTSPTTACEMTRIGSVRIAIVARSAQYETAVNNSGNRTCRTVTGAAPVWDASNADNPSGSAAAPINVSKFPDGTDSTDWQCYRYRTFQSVVPLRNINWQSGTGC